MSNGIFVRQSGRIFFRTSTDNENELLGHSFNVESSTVAQ